jgi:hypothetical protein
MKPSVKRVATTAAATGLLAIAMPAAGANADTLPGAALPSLQMPGIDFVPPKVGQLSVDIGPTIIGGQVIDRGLHVSTAGTSLPPINLPSRNWTPPRPRPR